MEAAHLVYISKKEKANAFKIVLIKVLIGF